jgi:hypothetical protein
MAMREKIDELLQEVENLKAESKEKLEEYRIKRVPYQMAQQKR